MLQGTAFGDLADTYDTESKDYGALAVVTIHGGSAA
ncbi:MAG: hypothetical protein JWO82_2499 [Akkermansiaceae bacterium]|nr:hypothetical protein [Akkermansiaceae bacterium]